MRSLVKATLLAATLLATGTVVNAQVSIGIVIAPPPPARVVVVVPERPAPEFASVEGYLYPVGNHYKWHEGYWTRPPYEGGSLGCTAPRRRTVLYRSLGKEIAAVLSTTTTRTTTEKP
jgi:hypothetical protein